MDKQELRQAFAEAQAQIMMQAQKVLAEKMTTVCFERCISGPTEKLSDKQRRCLDACTSSFLEGFQIATETVQNIAKKEAASSHE